MTTSTIQSPKPREQTPAKAAARRRSARSRREAAAGWGFVAPALAIVLGLTVLPGVWALVLSFQSWDGFSTAAPVGTQNYQDLVTDASLGAAVLHGPHVANFAPAYAALDQGGGAVPVGDAAALAAAVARLLTDPATAEELRARARAVHEGLKPDVAAIAAELAGLMRAAR